MNIPETMIEQAVELIINTRDLCGNERTAVLEFAREQGLAFADASKLQRIANFRANAQWNTWKKRAGVDPKHTW